MRRRISEASDRRRLAFEPNIVPFIDVLLVLLIIFMVTAPRPTTDLRLDLEQRAPPRPILARPTLVEVGAGLALSVDGESVALGSLNRAAFDHALANNPSLGIDQIFAEARIFVRADQSIAYGDVVRVMDELQQAHFAKVGVFAETAEAG